jgi:polar amino acid transport system substrate-binding protein
MNAIAIFGLALALVAGGGAAAIEDNVMQQLAPTGKLRVGVAYAPSPTPIFVAKDAAGDVHGAPRSRSRSVCRPSLSSRQPPAS